MATDIMGPLQETDRGNLYILVVQDYFTKWVECYPIPNQEAETVAGAIVRNWVSRYGAPMELHSDQGRNFESAVFQGMCGLLGIAKTHTTPFRPQSDGMVERCNATLQEILTNLSEKVHWEWDLLLPLAAMVYNSSEHSATGISPHMMTFGREMTLPADIEFGWFSGREVPTNEPEYVTQLREDLEWVHRLGRDALGKATSRAKRQYHKGVNSHQYRVGDPVWHLVNKGKPMRGKCKKFVPNYDGPFFVLKTYDDMVLVIQRDARSAPKTVHHDKVKPYHPREQLDNAWVFRKAGQQPEATASPSLGDLFETQTADPTTSEKGSEVPEECTSGTGDGGSAGEGDRSAGKGGRSTGKGGRSTGKGRGSTRRGGGSAGVGRGSRPGRVRRAPDRLGEWARG